MNQGLIPRRYAMALYKVDLDRNTAARTYTLMTTLQRSFDELAGLKAAVSNPFVVVDDKVKLLTTAAGAAKADTTFADFLKLLVGNSRIDMVDLIARAYCDIYRRENNIRRVEVVTAASLDSAAMQRIKDLVVKELKGASMEFSTRVDSSLIGGFVINIDNERLDASLSNQLKELRLSLLQ